MALRVSLLLAILYPLAALAQGGNPGWIADQRTGCRVPNPKPIPSESVSWTGNCVNGMAEGQGVLQWFIEGKLYARKEGEFRSGRMAGWGKALFNGMTYEGQWRDGSYDGRGVFTWPNGDRYVGGFLDGELSGHGTFTAADGSRYDGEWRHSMRDGPGTDVYVSGIHYEGEWSSDRPNGRGKATLANGRVYEGLWTNGCFQRGNAVAAIATTREACGFK